MTDTPEPILEVIRRKDLAPGDVVILNIPRSQKVGAADYERFSAFLQATFPEQKHMVISNGVRVEFRRPSPPKNAQPKESPDAGSQRDAAGPEAGGAGDDNNAAAEPAGAGSDGG